MRKKLRKEEFIEKAKQIHGDKYDYSKVDYVDSQTKVCIICPIHGEFLQTPNAHLRKQGCRKCGLKQKANSKKLTTEKFIEKARKKHDDKYDYSKVNYVDYHTKVCIICPIHGEFWQEPSCHLSNCGCFKCGREKNVNSLKLTTQQFIERAKKVHGNKYDYSKVEYEKMEKKVCIICPVHGEFWQTPHNHLRYGCFKCRDSKLETKIRDFLIKNNVIFEEQKTFEWLNYKKQLYLDFYLPEYNIAIECQGEQHFSKYRFEKDDKKLEIRQNRDRIKKELCFDNDIKILYYSDVSKYDMFLGEKIIKDTKNLKEKIYG